MPDAYQVFAPPRVDAPAAPVARSIAAFLWGRVKTLAVLPAILAFLLLLSFPETSGRLFLTLWGVCAVPFVITSVVLFRLHFLPQATNRPMYTSVAGRPIGAAEGRLLQRTQWVEASTGLLLLPILALFAGLHGGWFAAFATLCFLLFYLVAMWLGWVDLRFQLADLAMRDQDPE
ncbi:MAG: hypothetical protein JRI25_02890, partial [Deltaproteobacteria bacterium]|nr:hypothetical protein [Deltaproteobacteria bacterium]